MSGLDEVIVSDDLTKSLREIVSFEKARSIMFGQWGFGKRMSHVRTRDLKRFFETFFRALPLFFTDPLGRGSLLLRKQLVTKWEDR